MPTPSAAPNSFEMIRVVVSVPLPAANGSTRVMLRVGYAGVCAKALNVKAVNATASAAMREHDGTILFLLPIPFLDRLFGKLACQAANRKWRRLRLRGRSAAFQAAPGFFAPCWARRNYDC